MNTENQPNSPQYQSWKSFVHRYCAQWAILLLVAACAWMHLIQHAHAFGGVTQPNLEYVESTVDLRVKVLGGYVQVRRTWSEGRWYVNSAWADLKFTLDPLDNTVKSIERAGSVFQKSGTGIYVFDRQFFISRSVDAGGALTGWRWYNRRGDYITYDPQGKIVSYGDRNNIKVTFVYDATGRIATVNDHFGATALTYSYTNDLLTKITDRAGRNVQYAYTGTGVSARLTSVTDVTGYVWLYTYNGDGQITSTTDPENRTFTITYLSSVATPGGSLSKAGVNGATGGSATLAAVQSTSGVVTTKSGESIIPFAPTALGSVAGQQSADILANPIGSGLGGVTKAGGLAKETSVGLASSGGASNASKIARVAKVVDPLNQATVYTIDYDRVARRYSTSVKYPGGRTTDSVYDTEGRELSMNMGSRAITALNRLSPFEEETADERGYVTKRTYDAARNLLKITYPDGASVTTTFDANFSLPLLRTDERGNQTKFEYDARGNLARITEAFGALEAQVTEMTYDQYGQQLSRIRRDGKGEPTSTYTYDAYGNFLSTKDGEGNIVNFSSNDVIGNPLILVDQRGFQTEMQYDGFGRLLSIKQSKGTTQEILKLYSYDKVGNLTKAIDERGKIFEYRYTPLNRMAQEIDPYGKIYKTEYNAAGYPTIETDEENRVVTQSTYDVANYLTSYKDGKNNETTLVYTDSTGSHALPFGPASFKYPTYEARNSFDSRHRLSLETLLYDNEGLVTSHTYDASGNKATIADADGKTTFFENDRLNRPTKITNRIGAELAMVYDKADNLIQLKDGKGNAHSFEYDKTGRVKKEILPLGQIRTYVRDAKGSITEVNEPNGQKSSYEYDSNNRIIGIKLYPAQSSSPSLAYTLGYDSSGNLISWNDGTHSGVITYDEAGRMLSETIGYGSGIALTYRYTYFANGLKKILTYPASSGVDGLAVTYAYDAHDEVNSITIPNEGTIAVNEFKWMMPTKSTMPGGSVINYNRDGLLRIASLNAKNPAQVMVADLSNKYNRLTDVSERTLDGKNATFQYDAERRITGVTGNTPEFHTYDKADNRITSSAAAGTWVYDANNRLTQRGAIGYEYDSVGNVTKKTDATISAQSPSITIYRYDAKGRLVQVEDVTGLPATQAGTVTARYAYDVMDRRLWKEVGGVKTLFLHADEGLIMETTAAGTPIKSYGWKADSEFGMSPQFMRDHTTDQFAYFINDHSSSPIRALNKAGDLVWKGDYNSMGALKPDTAVTNLVDHNLRRPGQYEDKETGLYYNWNRYYDPASGRYITQDPLGFGGSSANLYDYANQNATNMVDNNGKFIVVLVPVVTWAWRIIGFYDLYKDITNPCMDPYQVLIGQIPYGRMFKKIRYRKKYLPDPPNCPLPNSFSGETLVHAWDAERQLEILKPIADIRIGDKVLAYAEWEQEASKALRYDVVEDVISSYKEQKLIAVTFNNGETIRATPEHPFKTENGWRAAALLDVGNLISTTENRLELSARKNSSAIRMDGAASNFRVVSQVIQESKILPVYNLEVASSHTFYVGKDGVLVHNGRGATGKARETIWDKCGGMCSYCGCQLQRGAGAGNSFECDHYYPVGGGGPKGPENQVGSCRTCNRGFGPTWPGTGNKPTLPGR